MNQQEKELITSNLKEAIRFRLKHMMVAFNKLSPKAKSKYLQSNIADDRSFYSYAKGVKDVLEVINSTDSNGGVRNEPGWPVDEEL